MAVGSERRSPPSLTYQFASSKPRQTKKHQPPLEAMLYKPHTSMELGDAVLGHLISALVFVFDHMIPAVHNVVTWETDLSPIVPEWADNARPASTSKVLTAQPHVLTA